MTKGSFVGYEYCDMTVKRSMASLCADGYENFGWELEGTDETAENLAALDKVILKFKRDRKLRNKAELTRLQRNFDACVNEIQTLEAQKYIKASAVAFVIGIIGTACMAGSVFCFTAGNAIPGIILAIPALGGFVLPYFLYRSIVQKKTAQITPLIEQKYDEIYTVCEKANALLDNAD